MCQRKFRPIKYMRRYSYTKFGTFFSGPPGITVGRQSVCPSVPSGCRTPLQRVCCCGPPGQATSIDCCTTGGQQQLRRSKCGQCHVLS